MKNDQYWIKCYLTMLHDRGWEAAFCWSVWSDSRDVSCIPDQIVAYCTTPFWTGPTHCPGGVAIHQTTLPLRPLCLKSGMLHTLWAFSGPSWPFSTSSDTVFRSPKPVPWLAAEEVRPMVLPKGLILTRDLKLMRDMLLIARLLLHWRARRWPSSSSRMRSRASRRTERSRPAISCTSGSFSTTAWRNLGRGDKRELSLNTELV